MPNTLLTIVSWLMAANFGIPVVPDDENIRQTDDPPGLVHTSGAGEAGEIRVQDESNVTHRVPDFSGAPTGRKQKSIRSAG